ncbi:MAG: ABC transporter permease [Gammaproteobacteria bacterium]|nr:MAG: ABC transporter permease [Gammaproteobacteria bacterium]
MFYWSLKTLLAEPMRLMVSALAVAVSFVLVIFFSAVFEGESDQMVVYLEQTQADVWVMQKGVSNMHMASSMLWDWKADFIAKNPQVSEVAAILYLNGPIKAGGKDWFSYIIGLRPEHRRVGPWAMAEGKSIPGPGEAVIPEVITRLTGIGIGDEITMIDRKLSVVGLSRESFSMASSVVFVSATDLGDLLEASDQYSYVMVYAKPGVDPKDLARQIMQDIDKVNALSSDEFIASDWQLAAQMGAEIVRMMTLIGTLLSVVIVAFTAYSLIARKKRELAIAKALGFGNGQIYLAALFQTLVITVLGLLLAMLISFTILAWLPTVVPQINLAVRLHQFASIAIITLPIALLASLAVAHTVVRLDPVSIFHS